MTEPPESANAGSEPGERGHLNSTARRVTAGKNSVKVKPRREVSYRQICRIMGRNLAIINPPEPEQEQLELFEAQQ